MWKALLTVAIAAQTANASEHGKVKELIAEAIASRFDKSDNVTVVTEGSVNSPAEDMVSIDMGVSANSEVSVGNIGMPGSNGGGIRKIIVGKIKERVAMAMEGSTGESGAVVVSEGGSHSDAH